MAPLENFDIKTSYGHYHPIGKVDPRQFIELLKQGLEACRENSLKRLLFDARELSDNSYTTSQRYEIVSQIERIWDRTIRLAILNPPDRHPPDEFARNAAHNRGIPVGIFNDEQAAIEWLTKP